MHSPPPAKTHSVWQPDPGWANELSQTLNFDKFQLSAPKYLRPVPEATKQAGPMNLFTWRVESGTDVPKATLTAAISDDKQLLAESKSNMTKSMASFTGGTTRPLGLQAQRTGEPETGSLAGIPFTRYKWRGINKATRSTAEGLTYGGIDGDRAVMLLAIGFGDEGKSTIELMQAVIATLKKQ